MMEKVRIRPKVGLKSGEAVREGLDVLPVRIRPKVGLKYNICDGEGGVHG